MANARINRIGAAVHEIAQAMGAPTQYGEYPGYGLGYYSTTSLPTLLALTEPSTCVDP